MLICPGVSGGPPAAPLIRFLPVEEKRKHLLLKKEEAGMWVDCQD
jgi:hypothetical protein